MVKGKGKGKRWKKDWHHRVPDFKLVDCTPKPLNREQNQKREFKSQLNTKDKTELKEKLLTKVNTYS